MRSALRRVTIVESAPVGRVQLTLTDREREVLALLARGLTQAEIAVRLVITPKTVGTHIQRVLTKLGVHSRAQAVALAHSEGLAGIPPAAAYQS